MQKTSALTAISEPAIYAHLVWCDSSSGVIKCYDLELHTREIKSFEMIYI